MAKPMLLLILSLNLFLLSQNGVLSCNKQEQDSLLTFISTHSPPFKLSLKWFPSTNCCHWQGIACTSRNGAPRVTHLWLPEKNLSATSFTLPNLPFLAHINLSHNHLSGLLPALPPRLLTLDLSFNSLFGPLLIRTFPITIHTLDLSSNRFNGSFDPSFLLPQPSNLVVFNISNNTFTSSNPSSICNISPLIKILDFSMNKFIGPLSPSLAQCSNLQVFRAGSNSLTGPLPRDLYTLTKLQEISLHNNQLYGPINKAIVNLPNLIILELHLNQLSGEIPQNIGQLSKLEQLQLHSNNLNGTFPPSLTKCTNLTTLLLRNNLLNGQISTLNFSKLQHLQALDLGNNTFSGSIPDTLCLCKSITAIRLAFNQLSGEVPPCMASLKSLTQISLTENHLSNVVGTLNTLKHCQNLEVLLLARCFHDERMPDDDLLHLDTFKNLQFLSLGGCKLKGQIPTWISKLKKLKVLNLSFNKLSGPIPAWVGSMPSLYVLNLTQNTLTGEIPREITRLPALISDKSSTDMSHLALPFLYDNLQYNRLFNLPRSLKLGNNSLSGRIPTEIGQLKLLQVLELSNNKLRGSIPEQLSNLKNLEKLDMSGNDLTGEIPKSLTKLHFLSALSVADNDLEGEIPKGGQFETFGIDAFEGNRKLCGEVIHRSCGAVVVINRPMPDEEDDGGSRSLWYYMQLPLGLGYFVGLVGGTALLFFKSW